jgi:hypothetical protein
MVDGGGRRLTTSTQCRPMSRRSFTSYVLHVFATPRTVWFSWRWAGVSCGACTILGPREEPCILTRHLVLSQVCTVELCSLHRCSLAGCAEVCQTIVSGLPYLLTISNAWARGRGARATQHASRFLDDRDVARLGGMTKAGTSGRAASDHSVPA